MDKQQQDPEWERKTIEKLAFSSLQEQRSTRRWGIFFKSLIFIYIFGVFFLMRSEFTSSDESTGEGHTALVEVVGVISADSEANADAVITALRYAFENEDTQGVIMRINSPGGSPVQSGYINDEMIRLREKYPEIPLYVVIADMAASGGYYIAVGADKIYADKSSLVGSIGVRMDSFGFTGAMDKLGVERRLYTAGAHKGFLDPFQPAKDEDIQHIQTVLDDLHQQFIDVVKQGRGDRLKDNGQLFSGYIWSGKEAVSLGLIDGLASSSSIARNVIKAEKIIDFSYKKNYLDRFAERLGAGVANHFGQSLMAKIQ